MASKVVASEECSDKCDVICHLFDGADTGSYQIVRDLQSKTVSDVLCSGAIKQPPFVSGARPRAQRGFPHSLCIRRAFQATPGPQTLLVCQGKPTPALTPGPSAFCAARRLPAPITVTSFGPGSSAPVYKAIAKLATKPSLRSGTDGSSSRGVLTYLLIGAGLVAIAAFAYQRSSK